MATASIDGAKLEAFMGKAVTDLGAIVSAPEAPSAKMGVSFSSTSVGAMLDTGRAPGRTRFGLSVIPNAVTLAGVAKSVS